METWDQNLMTSNLDSNWLGVKQRSTHTAHPPYEWSRWTQGCHVDQPGRKKQQSWKLDRRKQLRRSSQLSHDRRKARIERQQFQFASQKLVLQIAGYRQKYAVSWRKIGRTTARSGQATAGTPRWSAGSRYILCR